MSKTTQKEKPVASVESHPRYKDAVIVQVRLTIAKEWVGVIHELTKISPYGGDVEAFIYGLATRGFHDQLEKSLEGTRQLGREYADYLRAKYLHNTDKG